MPILDEFERVPLSRIIVDRDTRQRRRLAIDDLVASIRLRGVVTPIICQREGDGSARLVAGECRLLASRECGLADIPVRWTSELSSTELQIIELEENVKRSDIAWDEQANSIARIHSLYVATDAGWTMTETADSIGMALSHVSLNLRIARELASGDEKVAACSSLFEARNLVYRRDSRAADDELDELLSVPSAAAIVAPVVAGGTSPAIPLRTTTAVAAVTPEPVLVESFLDWAPAYDGPKFNFIHCDFPYGAEATVSTQMSRPAESFYDNDSDVYFALLESFCRNLNRFCSLSAHVMFWTSSRILSPDHPYSARTRTMFRELAPSLSFSLFPLIWLKSDNVGVVSDTRHAPRHIYEVCLLASRGNREIVQPVADACAKPTDRRLHPSAKPEPMLHHFMRMFVDSNSAVLDPTAGAGSALLAADRLGASRVVGLEISGEYAASANRAFRQARLLRAASAAE